MNDKEKIIRKLIRKESLRMIKNSQVSFLNEIEATTEIKHSMDDVNSVIDLFEKKLEKLNNEEKSAMDKEDYLELRNVKEEQLKALSKVINGYGTKLELLNSQKMDLEIEVMNVSAKGSGVFKNQELDEFSNEGFEKGWGLRIESPNTSTSVIKQADHNNYKVVSTNIDGLQPGMLLMLPDLKIGGDGDVKVFAKREGGNGFDNIHNFSIENITALIKNPK